MKKFISIEEKANRYDKAIERAKKWFNPKKPDSYTCIIESIFPELGEPENESEEIKEWLIGYFQQCKLDGIDEYSNGLKVNDIINWIEQQNELKDYNSIDPYFGKPINNKTIPKFKVGDWVVTSYGKVNQVISINEDGTGYTLDDYTYFSGSWCDNYHLWNIRDVKDGDVLATESGRPFIVKGFLDKLHPNSPVACCGIDNSDNFYVGVSMNRWTDAKVYPATKEQCDTLFARMKEEGYQWDKNKKEAIKL